MRKILSVLLCVILLVTMVGCGGNSYTPPTYKNIDIENLPYSVPYYKDSALDILSVEMYQAAGDLYGNKETLSKLDACCETENKTRSEIVRKGIEEQYDRIEKE